MSHHDHPGELLALAWRAARGAARRCARIAGRVRERVTRYRAPERVTDAETVAGGTGETMPRPVRDSAGEGHAAPRSAVPITRHAERQGSERGGSVSRRVEPPYLPGSARGRQAGTVEGAQDHQHPAT